VRIPVEPILRLPISGRHLLRVLRSGATSARPPVAASATNHSFPPAPLGETPPPSLMGAASAIWVRRVVSTVNNILQGRLNVVVPLTLSANQGSTAVTDARISPFSALLFAPVTANAAAEIGAGTLYASSQTNGSAVISHANNAQTDRQFNMVIIG
jgi:hypothetical protein